MRLVKIPISSITVISPALSRSDLGDVQRLASSIKKKGDVDVPIKVRPSCKGSYELVWGFRRLTAASIAGLTYVTAIVEDMDDEEAFRQHALENLYRKDKNPIEEAEFFYEWKKRFNRKYKEIARLLGIKKEHIYNRVQLLKLSPTLKDKIRSGNIDTSKLGILHARIISQVSDHVQQERLAEEVVTRGLTVRQLKQKVLQLREARDNHSYDGKLVDLTQPISFNISGFNEPPNIQKLHISTNEGTHIDAPYQFFPEGKTIDQFPLDKFLGEAKVLEVDAGAVEPITLSDVDGMDDVKAGNIVIFYTGWGDKYGEDEYRIHPYLSKEVASMIVKKGIKIVGFDLPTPEFPRRLRNGKFDYPIHKLLLSKEILIIENLKYVREIVGKKVMLHAFPIYLRGGDAGLARVIARVLD